jgi:ABC-type Fe3+-citrate transport system substrate-binding protein
MIKQNRTKLQIILGILMLTFAVAGCNGGDTKETSKDTTVTEKKDTVKPMIKDSTDTMETKTGSVSPTPGGGN